MLNLGGYNLGAAGAASLSAALKQNRTLVALQLDAEVSQITKYIERNRTLVNNLITAIRTGTAESIATINELIHQGTAINQILGDWSQDQGSSPMMIACKEGNIAVIQTLLPHWNHHDLSHKKAILEIIIEKNDPAIIQSFTTHAIRNDDQTIIQALAITEAQQLQEHARQGIEYYNQGNYLEALKHLQPAAEQGGHAEAQYTLGLMYEKGQGVPQDDTTALKFYQQAAAQGHPNAKKQLDLIQRKPAEQAQEEQNAAAAPAAYQQSPATPSFDEFLQQVQQTVAQMQQQTTIDLQRKLQETEQSLLDELRTSNIENREKIEQRILESMNEKIRQAVQGQIGEYIGEYMAEAVNFTEIMNKKAAQLEAKVTQLQEISIAELRSEIMIATAKVEKNYSDLLEMQTNKATLQQHAQQLEEQLKSSQLTTEQQQQLQAELLQLKLQVIEIDGYQQILWQEYQVKEQKREAIRQFQACPNLLIFYRTVQIKLEEIFIGSKAAASAFVNVASGNIATAGKAIGFFGGLAEEIPIAGRIVKATASVAQKGMEILDEQRQSNTVKHISALATMAELKKHTEQVAIQLTKWYEPQLRKLATPEQAQKQGFKGNISKVKGFILKAEDYPPARLFAEFGVKWMLGALQDLQSEIQTITLSKQLIEIVTHHKSPGKLTSVATALKKLCGIETVKTTEGIKWSLSHIYTETGIQTQDGCLYSSPKLDTAKYGYCSAASKEQAEAAARARVLTLRLSPQASQDAGGISKGTIKEVHVQSKIIAEQTERTEVLQRQLEQEKEERCKAQRQAADADRKAAAAQRKAEHTESRLAQMERQMAEQAARTAELMQMLQQGGAAPAAPRRRSPSP